MGYSGAQFDPEKVDLYFESEAGKLKIIENGVALDYSEEKATEILSQAESNGDRRYQRGRCRGSSMGLRPDTWIY